ncbi:MAG: two-component regulator propeller domain-containing protein [Congregibacter sp.]
MQRYCNFFAIFFATTLLLSSVSVTYAQNETSQVAAVVREAFAIRAFDDIELPQSSVRAVHVCRRGYLWVGTREGLVQFKAGQQRVWQQSDNLDTGIPSALINTIFEDAQGNIWIGTARGIAVMSASGTEFSIVSSAGSDSAVQRDVIAFADIGDQLVAVTLTGELLRVTASGARTLLRRTEADDVRFPQRGEQTFTSASASAGNGELYVGTSGEGIFRLYIDGHFFDVLEQIPAQGAVVETVVTQDSLLWLDRHAGMQSQPIGGSSAQRTQVNPLSRDVQGYFRAMTANSQRSAWLAAGPNVVRIRGDKADVVRLPGKGNLVRSITVDRAGNIWIGTFYGLYYALDTPFNTLQSAAAHQAGVLSTMASIDNRLYIGGQNLWVGDLDGDRFEELTAAPGLPPISGYRLDPRLGRDVPITALAASNDILLAGYNSGGIDVIDLNNGQVTNVTEVSPEGESLENSGVTAFAQVDENTWLATLYMFGLVEISVRPGASAPVTHIRLLSSQDMIAGVYRVDDNRYLAVTETDLLIVDRDSSGNYSLRNFDKGPGGIVLALEPDGLGGVYLGIENVGVRHLPKQMIDTAVFAGKPVPVVEEYLARRTVWHLLLDTEDTLWATTNNGVYSFDLPREELISHTTYRDGLPSKEFEYGPNASLLAANGDKLFVSSTGPVAFKAPVQPRSTQIRLDWTNVAVDGESIIDKVRDRYDPVSELSLPFTAVSDGMLALEYGYDDHIRALDATYVLRFSEDSEWIPGGRPGVSMTGQQEWGPIDLEFAMLDSNGAVISEARALRVNVAPPWYMLWWIDVRVAIPLCVAVGLLLLATQIRARKRQQIAVKEAAREREIVEAEMRGRLSEKEILLREIHHRVGNILSNFAANVRTMQRGARSDETRDTLEHLNARIKVQSAVHMLLQRSDRTDINVANMIRQVTAGARDFFGSTDERQIHCRLDDVYMTYSKAQYLGLIVNELLTNSYKHGDDDSEHPRAEIVLRRDRDGGAEFHYRDFGSGIHEKDINEAMETRRYGDSGGLGQVIAMARELKGDPVLFCDQGMHLSFRLPRRLIRDEVDDLVTGDIGGQP